MHFADLVLAAIGRRMGRLYALWAVLRDRTEPRGVGCTDRDLVQRIGRHLGFSRRPLGRILKAGDDVFWTRNAAGDLFLRSPARVAAALDVPAFRAAFREPIATLRADAKRQKARLALRSIAAIRNGLPTSNATIAKMLRVDVRSVQLWKRSSGMRTIPNYALVAPCSSTTSIPAIAWTTRQAGLRIVRYRKRSWLVRRLPDSFPDVGTRGVRSHLRRCNRRLRLIRAGRPTSGSPGGGNVRRRLYDAGRRRLRLDPSVPQYTFAGHPDTPSTGSAIRLWRPALPGVLG